MKLTIPMGSPEPTSQAFKAAKQLIQRARRRGFSVLTVESCTAGAMASLLASTPGAGDAFHGGFVAYSKENKTAAVGVSADLIRKHTAVSAPVAKAMAQGGLERSPADIALAITGVAGPEPDEDGNPVGLVFVAVAGRQGQVLERKLSLKGSKDEICHDAMTAVIELGHELIAG
jgi:nicotinamide-nucleotide amidase